MVPIVEPAIRPPSEADSFLLQVTLGCSSNTCTFCGAYQNKPFRVKSLSEIDNDIDKQRKLNSEVRRVFLMDGDALAVKNEILLPVLGRILAAFPALTRISTYANGYNISSRSDECLRRLFNNKLRLIYLGLESGSQRVLDLRRKRASVAEMVEGVNRSARFGIKSSVIVLLGIGGKEHSHEHVRETILALNQMQPRYLSFLSLMVVPQTPLAREAAAGKFRELEPDELLREAYDIIEGLSLSRTVFRCDHSSNYLALEARLPHDKEKLLESLKAAIRGEVSLRPEIFRGL
jgi:radical SAM superfamily enzyme YgiQ (UPF0313 family)